MSPPSILPPLLLCIALLLPIAYQQSPPNGGNQSTATANRSPAREYLEAHNKVRMNLTHPPLVWDKALVRYARRWGMKLIADCKMVHSLGPYGENLFWGKYDNWTPTQAVESWVSEREFYDARNNSCTPGEMCGHYTQVIWRDSLKVGCTRAKCQNGGVLIICEYDPPGNYVNESPFDTVNAGAGTGTTAKSGGGGGTAAANPKSTGNVPPPGKTVG